MGAPASTHDAPVSTTELGSSRRQRSQTRIALGNLRRSTSARIGGGIAIILVVVALLSPWITPYDPIDPDPPSRLLGPSLEHPFGTDKLGRDIFSRVIAGAPYSLAMGLIAVAIGATVGVTLGLVAGYYTGRIDSAIMMLSDAMLAFPSILLALAIVAALGTGLGNTMIAVGVSWIPGFIRIARGSVLAARETTYVEAARVSGATDGRIIVAHILPNILAPVIVLCTLGIAGAILVGASLSFLGLGAQPPTPEWGAILNDGRSMIRLAPWLMTFPGLAIMITVLAMNLLGDGLRDALDPRMKL
jgi:peptide/nickel transport system permease protein